VQQFEHESPKHSNSIKAVDGDTHIIVTIVVRAFGPLFCDWMMTPKKQKIFRSPVLPSTVTPHFSAAEQKKKRR
jgi:hypothetical protein